MVKFSDRLQKLRKEKGISMGEMARDIETISQSSLSNYENGKRSPGIDKLIKLSDYFNCNIDYLTGRSIFKNPEKIFEEYKINNEEAINVIRGLMIYKESGLSVEEMIKLYRIIKKIKSI